MSPLDYAVLLAYVAVVVAVGARAAKRQTDTDAYFLGGRAIPWWAAGLSIVATSFSAASILGVPGYAYAGDLWYLGLSVGDLLAAAVVAWLFIPFFRAQPVVSAYELLEARFDRKTRLAGSGLFMVSTLFRAGLLLFGAALLFSELVPLALPGLTATQTSIVCLGFLAIVYTLLGGITAVVITDVVQFAVMAGGMLAAIAIAGGALGGVPAALEQAASAGKLQIAHLEWDRATSAFPPLKHPLTALVGYGLLALSLFGTNQQPVQRYLAVKDVTAARRALLLGAGSGAIGVALSLLLGAVLFVYYQAHPGGLGSFTPASVPYDKVVPIFISTVLPAPLKGLLAAAVLAAAMSSLDSALNACAAAFVTDVWSPRHPAAAEPARLRMAKVVVAVTGVIGIGIGLFAAEQGEGLIDLILRFTGYFGGAVLGLFVLAMAASWVGGTAAFTGALVGTAFTISVSAPLQLSGVTLQPPLYAWIGLAEPVPKLWLTPVSFAVTLAVAFAIGAVMSGRRRARARISA